MKYLTKRSLVFSLLLTALTVLCGQARPKEITVALIDFENMDEADDYDYMGTLAMALIKEDLTRNDDIILVDRDRLKQIVEEQSLQLSGIMDEETTVEIGKLLGCDYLCSGNFVVMGDEVLLDMSLTEVETGRVTSFSTRGDSEDLFHLAAEKLVRQLTGKNVLFRDSGSNSPILKHIPKDPGTLNFYSYLIDARIYIDDKFYGYTTGDRTVPKVIELPPGEHTIMVDLGPNFGFVVQPEITFEKWHQTFEIQSRGNLVMEDKSRHFNDWLRELHNLIRDDADFYQGEEPRLAGEPVPFSFIDRQGRPVDGALTVSLSPGEENRGIAALITLEYNDFREEMVFECPPGEEREFQYTHGLADLKLTLSARYEGKASADWDLTRNDVYQGMHRE